MNPVVKRNIIFYFITDISVFTSVYMSFFTLTWITFKITGSPSSLGLVGFAENLPFLLFSIYGGVLADRYDRRRIVIKCNIGLVTLTSLTIIFIWLNILSYPLILFLSFSIGSIMSINMPSMIGLVKDLVTDKKLFPRIMGAAASNIKFGEVISSSTFTIVYSALSAIGTFIVALAGNLIALFSIITIKKVPLAGNPKTDSVMTQLISGLKSMSSNINRC